MKRLGGRVFLSTLATSATVFRCPLASPGGSTVSSLSSSLFLDGASGSTAFQPASTTIVPVERKRSTTFASAAPAAVTTVVVAATCSSCQAARSRRTTKS